VSEDGASEGRVERSAPLGALWGSVDCRIAMGPLGFVFAWHGPSRAAWHRRRSGAVPPAPEQCRPHRSSAAAEEALHLGMPSFIRIPSRYKFFTAHRSETRKTKGRRRFASRNDTAIWRLTANCPAPSLWDPKFDMNFGGSAHCRL